ncbi:MAG: ATP-binding protein, partial [Myxococcales bacterium]|nr:ATP-binding protein [Myxococcales bacterium]
LEKRRLELSGRFAELVDHDKERIGQLQWSLLAGTRQLANRLGADLDRIDVRRFARRERRPDDKELASLRGRLEDLPARWHSRQRLIFDRARLGLKLATFQHRLTSIVERDNQALVLSIQNGVLGECKQVLQSLKRLAMQLRPDRDDDSPLVIAFDDRADFDKRVDVEAAIDALVTSTADLAAELPTTVNTLSDESIKRLGEGQVDEVETVDVPVQRLAQFLVEARFIGVVQAALEKVPALEAQAAGVAQDAIRLVRFQLSELDAESSESGLFVAEQLAPVAESGIERLTAEIEGLEEALAQVTTTMTTQLAQVVEGTNPYEIARTAADLAQHIRRHHGERAAAGARSLFRRGSERVSEALVQLVYRKSAGLLLARERRESPAASQATLVDRLLDLVEAHRPRPELLDSLPSYYRQLFYGQATINETFWVGREAETAAARRAVASFGRGSVGALVITGERGSGKTSLIGRLTSDLLSRRIIYRVMPSKSGITAAELDAAIASAVGTEGEADEVLAHLPDGTVIVIDDLETWWERHRDGFGAIDRALDLVERFGDRILFVLSLSSQAFAFLSRFRPLGDDALAVIRCRPVSAEELKSVVMLRHGSTGLKFSLDGKAEDTLSDLRLARLFNRHFDYSGGYLGAALRSWITHVRRVSGQSLEVTMPKAPEWEILDELRPSLVAILIELILHKTLSREQLRAISARPKHDVEQEVNVLLRAGLVVEGQGHGLTINPFLHHALILRLRRRGLLA